VQQECNNFMTRNGNRLQRTREQFNEGRSPGGVRRVRAYTQGQILMLQSEI
jgi:hypothetical protein